MTYSLILIIRDRGHRGHRDHSVKTEMPNKFFIISLCSLCSLWLRLFNRPEPAGPDAGFALGTKVWVDPGRLLLFPGYGVARAGLEAEPAHLAFFFDYFEANQGRTYQG